jgi:hypothetical protein
MIKPPPLPHAACTTTAPTSKPLDTYFSTTAGPRKEAGLGAKAAMPPSTSDLSNPAVTRRFEPSNSQTRSQRLFSITTSIDPRSLSLQDSVEFYLFMDMHAEFKWLSYQMTSKCWALATEEYNCRLMKKAGNSVVKKNPKALLHALGNIEPRLMNRIIKNDYKCAPVCPSSLTALLTPNNY